MTPTEASTLTAAEEAALTALMAGPLVTVSVRIAIKFRALGSDFGTLTITDHTWQWPIPAVFARAYPNPVSINTHGIQMEITLTPPADQPPAP